MYRYHKDYHKNVFVNCPFDDDYQPLLRALLFTLVFCGQQPRIASERVDSGETRISKIVELIKSSRYSIHDISRIEPLREDDLPRFNMPFELGLDIGARLLSEGIFSSKKCLILEKEKYRYQMVMSDVAGHDIKAHNSDENVLVKHVRNWVSAWETVKIPSHTAIWYSYNEFLSKLDRTLREDPYGYKKQDIEEMPTIDFMEFLNFFLPEWFPDKIVQRESTTGSLPT